MTCFKCNYHFCWQCMGKFGSGPMGGTDGYSSHKCNGLFQPDTDTLNKQNELKVFNHYHDRFDNHRKSRELVHTALEEHARDLTDKIMHTGGHSRRQASFIEKAHEQDVINRTTLMNSYVFGYYR